MWTNVLNFHRHSIVKNYVKNSPSDSTTGLKYLDGFKSGSR